MFMSRFSVFTVLAVGAILPVFAFAATTSTTKSSTTTAATTTLEIKATTTTPVVTTPTKTAAVLSTTAQIRITNLAANLSNREDATVRRLQNVSNRLTTRLATLKAAGKNVTVTEQHLADTKSNLDIARSTLTTIDKSVAAFVGSSNPQESWVNLKTTYTNINTNIRAALEALKAAVTAAEVASSGAAAPVLTASSTATSTATTTKTKK